MREGFINFFLGFFNRFFVFEKKFFKSLLFPRSRFRYFFQNPTNGGPVFISIENFLFFFYLVGWFWGGCFDVSF